MSTFVRCCIALLCLAGCRSETAPWVLWERFRQFGEDSRIQRILDREAREAGTDTWIVIAAYGSRAECERDKARRFKTMAAADGPGGKRKIITTLDGEVLMTEDRTAVVRDETAGLCLPNGTDPRPRRIQ